MQNKGAIRLFAIVLALICIYQLSFTFFTQRIENRAKEYATNEKIYPLAKEYAKGDAMRERMFLDSIIKAREKFYLDSMSGQPIFNLLIKKYTYKECKERELNLGLDLKGGMNVTLEVSVDGMIETMSGNSNDPVFNKALDKAREMEKNSQKDFVTLFGEAFQSIDPKAKLSNIFNTIELKDKISYNSTNEEVLKVIRDETNGAIDRTFNILRTRIDHFGVTQPNIQKLQTAGRILVELPGIKEPERVRKLLQGTAQLEFWETFEYKDVYSFLAEANKKLKSVLITSDTTKQDTLHIDSLKTTSTDNVSKKDTVAKSLTQIAEEKSKTDTTSKLKGKESFEDYAKENPLFAYLKPALSQDEKGQYYPNDGPVVGYANIMDTARINKILKLKDVKNIFPKNLKLLWTVKPIDKEKTTLQLIALKTSSRDGSAALGGEVVTDAYKDISDSRGVNAGVTMIMNSEGAKIWKRLTADHIGDAIAIVLDNYVYSFPNVQSEIPNGRSEITGNFSIQEADDLANVLKAGKLPAPARIVEEAVVGPTLGKEAINAGLWSFIVAFIVTLLYMIFYYNRAGLVANVALFTNMFFVFGILASLQAVLTLPGIAGLVLTIGMDVDKNVIIYERIREEIRAGKGIRLAINDGYKHAYSAIIDSNIITFLTGVVLYVFGSGPIQGFAATLMIGIISSLFCAIFITKLIFIWMMDKNKEITVWNNITKNFLTKVNIDFIGIRKILYITSGVIIVIGIISLSYRGLNYGIDFLGGRTYVVRFDKDVKTSDIRYSLLKTFGDEPEVKTFGPNNQVKITTSYLIDDKSTKADSIVESKLYDGVKTLYSSAISKEDFLSHSDKKVLGKLSSQKIEPMIAYDLLVKAYYAVFFSLLIIFIYIAIRFRKWQWGLGGVISLFHDTFITITIFSLFYGVLPFSLEIDQHFIAAILTIIGYSIMDSVIIFDRIREYTQLYPKRDLKTNMNQAMNSTLGRTLNTSGITFLVLLSIFIFGGEVIRGFAFALLVGIVVGTYSSVFNATPIAYDFIMWRQAKKEQKNKN